MKNSNIKNYLYEEPNPNPVIMPRFTQEPIIRAEYIGPLTLWKGKTALLQNLVAVQFDDRGQYMAWGWHLFNASDWKVPETRPLYTVLANAIEARANCIKNDNKKWLDKWTDFILELMKEHAPSGFGFDNGTILDADSSNSTKVVFHTSYHHMDDNGFYTGWTEHQVVVTPSLTCGFDVRVTGPNRNDIKTYIAEVFHDFLTEKVNGYV